MPNKNPDRRPRPVYGSKMFKPRTIITVPEWSLPVIAIATVIGIRGAGVAIFVTSMSAVLSGIALVTIRWARRSVKSMRLEVAQTLAEIRDADTNSDADMAESAEPVHLLSLNKTRTDNRPKNNHPVTR